MGQFFNPNSYCPFRVARSEKDEKAQPGFKKRKTKPQNLPSWTAHKVPKVTMFKLARHGPSGNPVRTRVCPHVVCVCVEMEATQAEGRQVPLDPLQLGESCV